MNTTNQAVDEAKTSQATSNPTSPEKHGARHRLSQKQKAFAAASSETHLINPEWVDEFVAACGLNGDIGRCVADKVKDEMTKVISEETLVAKLQKKVGSFYADALAEAMSGQKKRKKEDEEEKNETQDKDAVALKNAAQVEKNGAQTPKSDSAATPTSVGSVTAKRP